MKSRNACKENDLPTNWASELRNFDGKRFNEVFQTMGPPHSPIFSRIVTSNTQNFKIIVKPSEMFTVPCHKITNNTDSNIPDSASSLKQLNTVYIKGLNKLKQVSINH